MIEWKKCRSQQFYRCTKRNFRNAFQYQIGDSIKTTNGQEQFRKCHEIKRYQHSEIDEKRSESSFERPDKNAIFTGKKLPTFVKCHPADPKTISTGSTRFAACTSENQPAGTTGFATSTPAQHAFDKPFASSATATSGSTGTKAFTTFIR